MHKTLLAAALMLRVFWTSHGAQQSGVVLGTAMLPAIDSAWLVVRTDDGKVREILTDKVESSRWEETKP